MSQGRGSSSLKRKHPSLNDKDMSDVKSLEDIVLGAIQNKGDMGIWKTDLKKELSDKARQNRSKLPNDREVENIIKKLLANKKIKEVPNIKDKGKNRLMASDVTPSTDLKGAWYYDDNGNVDNDMIHLLKQVIKHIISQQNVATADRLCKEVNKTRTFEIQFEPEMITEMLNNMIFEKEIVKVKSNGMGEFSSFPINVDCYKVKSRLAKVGAFATVPCGACPRIHQCSPDGIISPATCAYYTQWLDF